ALQRVVHADDRAFGDAVVEAELVDLVRERIGPVAAFRKVVVVDRLPKTRSGKILRGTMKKIVDQTPFDMPATIEDAAALDDLRRALGL
ncbi:MAG: propionyl-CoA synthetase, partial [Sphingomonas sp.]